MKTMLLNKCRQEYVKLNKRFLQRVEDGAPWEELQPLIDEMKSLAIYLQQIPTSLDVSVINDDSTRRSSGTGDSSR